MRAMLAAMPSLMRAALATMLQYRGEIVLWAVWGLVFPAVSIAMWTAAGKGRPLAGFLPGDVAAYFLMTMVIGHLTVAWDVYEMGFLVRTGRLSPKLLRPLLPIWESIAANLAYKLLTMVLLVPIWLGIAAYVQPTFHTTLTYVLLGLPAVLLAAAIAFVWGYITALLAFVMTKMDAAAELYFGLSLFLGGRFAALDWLPESLRYLTWLFPFRWSMAFPVELVMGRLDAAGALAGFAWQITWLAAGIGVFRWAWGRGVRRYSAVGA